MKTPQQTPWRIDGGRVYDAYGNQVTLGLDNLEFVIACVNQHNELLAEIVRLRAKVAELESLFPKMGK